jgi:hypothetical protein
MESQEKGQMGKQDPKLHHVEMLLFRYLNTSNTRRWLPLEYLFDPWNILVEVELNPLQNILSLNKNYLC